MDVQQLIEKGYELGTTFGVKILAALAVFIIGRWIVKYFRRLIRRVMERREVDPTLSKFLINLAYAVLLTFVILAALGMLGIQTTSFIAVLGAAGLAVGLALQGSLSNFAAGVLLIIFRPFKVGDFIEGAGVAGVVEEIQIFTTQMVTPDNKTIIIPNAQITSGNIINYSTKGTRRADMVFGIGYQDDIDKARGIISEVLSQDERVLKDPPVQIAVSELADSSVNFVARPWVKVEDYWSVVFDATEAIKKRFDAEGVSIPFPQRDVHVYEHKVT
ncbi:MAG: mechanosensitive ion channel [Deltaproteobacteria bacterium]|jgi:small conductance mechanosensitive channel|nr:mechanosensitive ion channel [Deltaproteobacteria bacterium]MBW2516253.1 mechanosensitive ion channel [Deltaproteobacteria bacterium]